MIMITVATLEVIPADVIIISAVSAKVYCFGILAIHFFSRSDRIGLVVSKKSYPESFDFG